jgi:hypothetical protein
VRVSSVAPATVQAKASRRTAGSGPSPSPNSVVPAAIGSEFVGRPAHCYNLFGLNRFKVYGEEPLPKGEHQVRVEFAYDGGGLGKGGTATLYVDGNKVGEGRIEGTVPMLFSGGETLDLGSDSGTPVSDDLPWGSSSSMGRCAGSKSIWATTRRTATT